MWTPTRQVPDEDITTPERYNFRKRRRLSFSSEEENDGYIIPPQLFSNPSESSYTGSGATDIRERCDTSLSSTEVQDLRDAGWESAGG